MQSPEHILAPGELATGRGTDQIAAVDTGAQCL